MSTANQATTAAPAAAQEPLKGGLKPPVADTDFKEKYPPDRELGHELDDTARVWKVYRGEAIDYDDALLKTWNETVNILLTFAGLFSAAVTSFVAASTDDLKPDPNAYVANLLFAMGNATAGASPFAHLPPPPPLDAAPTSLARVVNGFWYTSLFLSLAAALLCILVKQWLDEYTARTRGSAKHPHEWAQRRSFYFQGLNDWSVAAIISFLPLFLHLALFLFLAGLTAFLWDLDSAVRWVMLILMSMLLAFYLVSLFLPVWSAACPYATPLLEQLRNLRYTALVGGYTLRNRALTGGSAVRRPIHNVFNRKHTASNPTSSHNMDIESSSLSSESDTPTPDPQIKLLLEQRARRPFERVLQEQHWGIFQARLDCLSLKWLMHDVSDSDAVAVAWQSLSALLEEPRSFRSTRIVAVLPGLLEYAGGERKLWRALRLDGILDDLQLGRMTRSALFFASCVGSDLGEILYWGMPSSDEAYLENTLSPDAALVHAHVFGEHGKHVAKVARSLYEQGAHRPLPSTATFLVSQLQSESHDWVPEAVIGLLYYCNIGALPATAWTHVARVLGHSCTGREADPSHQCRWDCVVNAICACTVQLTAVESQNSSAPFGAYSHVQLVVRIISAVSHSFVVRGADLSEDVWTVLTDMHHFSCRMRSEDQIPALDWAEALWLLARSSNRFYTSFATQYNSVWSRLLRGFVRNHATVILEEGIDFVGRVDKALIWLAYALDVTPWQIEITDPALRAARLRSALALAESGSIAFCPVDLNYWASEIRSFVRGMHLLALFPTDLALGEEEHKEWVDLFVSAVQHLMVLDPLLWKDLRDAVKASTGDDIKTFFREVHTRLTVAGPCRNGDCAGKAPTHADWLLTLGTAL
ncbi:hypothetical protein EXIGLDRAFT_723711 [Exidia glandulosa HHB12029]|uniref:DUF6535 domain-containing protein n=1 Tax=Exidia glandulosa HHB12029 TaxID=1314781 RepID=A0A165EPX0_EXIGL|nr:hypothetical protein EXIGLDRAFT_723711 [Exidia glandulosa HHB12029]